VTDASLAERQPDADYRHIVRLEGVQKFFGAIHALRDIDLSVGRNEIVGLIGDNGAGKSTLIKVLTGVYASDTGSIELLGQPVAPRSPLHAQELGISAVHQESHLLPNLSVAEDI